MSNPLRMILVLAAVVASAHGSVMAGEASAEQPAEFKDSRDKASYAIGLNIGHSIKRGNYDVDLDRVMDGIKDFLGGEIRMTEQQARDAISAFQQEAIQKNREAGQAFLQRNRNEPGVVTIPMSLPDGTTAELQYKILKEGDGESPTTNDIVSINYRGTFINGTEFDSTARTGKPAEFQVGRVMRWTEAIQHMKVGSKWQFFIPASLAHGDRAVPGIEPGSTLIYEVELLNISHPAPKTSAAPAPARPLVSSDIISVPSAEEMKKGAKIEVIRAQDLEKSNSIPR